MLQFGSVLLCVHVCSCCSVLAVAYALHPNRQTRELRTGICALGFAV